MRVSTASRKLHFSDVFIGLYFQLPKSKTWLNPVEMHIRKERGIFGGGGEEVRRLIKVAFVEKNI